MDETNRSDRQIILQEYLRHVCVELGYCLLPKVQKTLIETPFASPHTFVDRVMIEDGINPSDFPAHRDVMLEMLKAVMEMKEFKDG